MGSNIYEAAGDEISAIYNSKNIEEAYGTSPELLIYSGLPAEKYLANSNPKKDLERIKQAEDNIFRINPKKLVLISTIDVFKDSKGMDENSEIDTDGLHAYGYNRYQLELWARKNYRDALIIRLPGLFGKNIKKNFIYDYIHVIPFMLKEEKFEELLERDSELRKYYSFQDNGFCKVNVLESERNLLKDKFKKIGFSALNFTDSRSVYQFYDLANLWKDIQIALGAGITLWHPATEPLSTGEIYEYLTGEKFLNELDAVPANYNYKTVHYKIWNGSNGYIASKHEILKGIAVFVESEDKKGNEQKIN